jgi:hypothetical protein
MTAAAQQHLAFTCAGIILAGRVKRIHPLIPAQA